MLRQHRPRHTPKGEGRACSAAAGTVLPEKTKKDGCYLFLRRAFCFFEKVPRETFWRPFAKERANFPLFLEKKRIYDII
jgi:hypothetical protein